jgi:hypothetical protein
MSCFFVQPVGFTEQQLNWLESLFAIAQNRLRDHWWWTAHGQADAYLVVVESLSQWQSYLAEFPQDRLVACVVPGVDVDALWAIPRTKDAPPSLHELIKVLDAMGAELGSSVSILKGRQNNPMPALAPEAPKAIAATAPPEPVNDSHVYNPEFHLPGILRDAQADGIPRRLLCDDGGALRIDPDPKLYFAPGDKIALWPILSAPRGQISVSLLSHADLAGQVAAIRSHGMALDELIFLSVLLGSKGRLWIGCSPEEPVRLRRWPDLKNLSQFPDAREYIRLATFMSTNTADIKTIVSHSGIQEEKVINFHNGFESLGLLDRGGSISLEEKSGDPKAHKLYEKIAARLKS